LQYKIKTIGPRAASILGVPRHVMFKVRRVYSTLRFKGLTQKTLFIPLKTLFFRILNERVVFSG
jgi:hypothetical protein